MKILHLITRLILGGAQENTVLTCEGLAARGHEVTLAFGPIYGPEGSLLERAKRGGYALEELPAMIRAVRPWTDYRAYRQCRELIRRIKPDVVHTHSSKAGIVGRAAAWAEKVPAVVHTIHGLPYHPYQSYPVHALYVAAERWAAKRCHAIACVADAMTRQALAEGVGTAGQYVTVYSGMEVEPFLNHPEDRATIRAELGLRPDDVVIGTVARLAELKGHDDLLDALGSLLATERNQPLVVIRGNELGEGLTNKAIRSAAWQYAKTHLFGSCERNLQTNREIHIGREGIKKVISHSADIRRALAIVGLRAMIRTAKYVCSEPPVAKGPNIKAYHRFSLPVRIGGSEVVFGLTIREDNNGDWFYSHHIEEKTSPQRPGESAEASSGPTVGEVQPYFIQHPSARQSGVIKLLWVGDGWHRPRLEKRVREMGLADRVVITGLVPPQRIPRLMRAMDVLAHPSYREGLARTIPQALLSGVPVVSYDCDGAGEVCIDGQTGRLVPTGDLAALREAVTWMLDHPAERAAMAERGRTLCAARFDYRVMVERLEELYGKVLDTHAASRVAKL